MMFASSSVANTPRKAYKVSNGTRRKLVMAANFTDLVSGIRAKFGVNGAFCVALEEDSTEIDDDECLQSLPEFTKFKIMQCSTSEPTNEAPAAAAGASDATASAVSAVPPAVYDEDDTFNDGSFKIIVVCRVPEMTQHVSVMATDTVLMLKEKLTVNARHSVLYLPVEHQRLVLDRKELADERTLTDCGIQRMNKVLLRIDRPYVDIPAHVPYEVHIKTFGGQTVTREMRSSDRVEVIRKRIQAIENMIPIENLSLYFRGKLLEDGHTLAECGVGMLSTLYVHMRVGLCPGCPNHR